MIITLVWTDMSVLRGSYRGVTMHALKLLYKICSCNERMVPK